MAGPAEIELTPEAPIDLGEVATIRISSTHEDPEEGIFIGVADTASVDTYLGGVPYAIVEDLDDESFSLTYRIDASEDAPAVPGEQPFWIDSTYGSRQQTLEWELESGDVSFVVMNADASDAVSYTHLTLPTN